MLKAQLDIFTCPHCKRAIHPLAVDGAPSSLSLNDAAIACERGHQFIVRNGIVRFLPSDEQGALAAERAQRYGRAALDSACGTHAAEKYFATVTGLSAERLAGRRVLEIGSHGGRFAEWTAHYASHLVIVDSTEAIDACRDNLGELPNVTYAQADPARLPLGEGGFDFIYALDALNRLSKPRETLQAAARCLRPGGEIAFNLNAPAGLHLRLLRPLTLRMPYRVVEAFLRGYHAAAHPPTRRSERHARKASVERRVLHDLEVLTTPNLWRVRPRQLKSWFLEYGLALVEKGYSPRRYRARKIAKVPEASGVPTPISQTVATRAKG